MKRPKEFSVQSIRRKAASLPETYYGDECNISLKSQYVTRLSAADGEPMKFDNFGISLCRGGQISAEVNLTSQTVGKGDFELFSPGTIYRLESMSEDCDLIGIAISPDLLVQSMPKEEMSFFTLVGMNSRVRLEEYEQVMFKEMAGLYLKVLQAYGESSNLAKGLTMCILQFAMRVCSSERARGNASGNRADELCKQFTALLAQARGTKRTIGWYAENLCVSSHYLSIAIKQSSGKTVKSLIDNAVINDIKILLRHSDLSISQIADRLEFPSSTFLCKYFKTHTGLTPLHYRNNR